MKPKEKAEELFIKCYPIWYNNGLVAKSKYAKEYAQIVVDEIIEAVKIAQTDIVEYQEYWKQVKEEIEKL